MPVKIEALQEGTVANVHVPVYQIFASDEYSRLITFLETILTQIWYPSTVATLSRRTRDLIEIGFEETADEEDNWQIDYKVCSYMPVRCTLNQLELTSCSFVCLAARLRFPWLHVRGAVDSGRYRTLVELQW